MRIGITYDLKGDPAAHPEFPDDFQEEFDSPATIEAIASVLRGLGHDVHKLGDGRELLQRLLAAPTDAGLDLVFNVAEGHGVARSREARVPAVLEMLDIPYTGSDPLTMAVTLDKECAKRLVASAGVPVPRGSQLLPTEPLPEWTRAESLPYAIIVKPAWEGSSKGIRGKCLVDRPDELLATIETLRRDQRQPLLLEEYIDGEELTVGIVGNEFPRVIGVMRVLPKRTDERFVYSLEVKRDWENRVRYECPPQLPDDELRAVEGAALTAFKVLGCRDVARIDFRLRAGIPYFLEVNPLPGLNPESSDLVLLARASGWTYERLIETIVQGARDRHPGLATR